MAGPCVTTPAQVKAIVEACIADLPTESTLGLTLLNAGDTIPASVTGTVEVFLADGTSVVLAAGDTIPANAAGVVVIDDPDEPGAAVFVGMPTAVGPAYVAFDGTTWIDENGNTVTAPAVDENGDPVDAAAAYLVNPATGAWCPKGDAGSCCVQYCVVDDDGTNWEAVAPIEGDELGAPVFVNTATGEIGTPVGATSVCPPSVSTLVDNEDGTLTHTNGDGDSCTMCADFRIQQSVLQFNNFEIAAANVDIPLASVPFEASCDNQKVWATVAIDAIDSQAPNATGLAGNILFSLNGSNASGSQNAVTGIPTTGPTTAQEVRSYFFPATGPGFTALQGAGAFAVVAGGGNTLDVSFRPNAQGSSYPQTLIRLQITVSIYSVELRCEPDA